MFQLDTLLKKNNQIVYFERFLVDSIRPNDFTHLNSLFSILWSFSPFPRLPTGRDAPAHE